MVKSNLDIANELFPDTKGVPVDIRPLSITPCPADAFTAVWSLVIQAASPSDLRPDDVVVAVPDDGVPRVRRTYRAAVVVLPGAVFSAPLTKAEHMYVTEFFASGRYPPPLSSSLFPPESSRAVIDGIVFTRSALQQRP